jgi:hypothetical protein
MAANTRSTSGTGAQSKWSDRSTNPYRARETRLPNPAIPIAAAPVATSAAESQANPGPTTDQIRCRAYDIYCARNGAPGDALSDWLAAERELCDAAQRAADPIEERREMALLAPSTGDPVC